MTQAGKSNGAMLNIQNNESIEMNVRKREMNERIFCLNMRKNVMIEEFQNHRYTIGKDQILTNVFELKNDINKNEIDSF